MPTWNELLAAHRDGGSAYDIVRRKYLRRLQKKTGRNLIIYYSGWLQKDPQLSAVMRLNDNDKNGFMATIHKLDRTKGLDLMLHTPGGEIAATESIVDYLRSMFGTNIRAIIPQLAMSGGTMIACACREILMGKHSSIGPIDPQIGGIPAHGLVEEWERANRELKTMPGWGAIISKYHPTLVGECEKACAWADEMVRAWLEKGMFAGDPEADAKIEKIAQELGDHALTKSHSRHISMDKAKEMGLKVVAFEDDDDLQDRILSVHHACIQTLTSTPAVKIIENHTGTAFILQAATK